MNEPYDDAEPAATGEPFGTDAVSDQAGGAPIGGTACEEDAWSRGWADRLDGRAPAADARADYRQPPASARFAKGVSGNPEGRPPRHHKAAPYETVLGRMVTVREDGATRRVTAAEAFLLHITKQGLEGNGAAARAAMAAIAQARADRPADAPNRITRIVRVIVTPGAVNHEMERLKMAVKVDRYRATARMRIEPWVVQAALGRLGERRLSREEQAEVYAATRTPGKVRWPAWWGVR